MLIESKLTPPNGSCAQDAAGRGVADQCRHLHWGARRRRALAQRRRAPTGVNHSHEDSVNRGLPPYHVLHTSGPLQWARGGSGATAPPLAARPCFATRLAPAPVLLDSTTSSCCCTFSSNFCVAMAEQLCSNPWRNNFVQGKIWDHPSNTTQE